MKRTTVLALTLALLPAAAVAGDRSGAPFLRMNPSARFAALGQVGTAVAADASSLFINPAGITGTPGRSLVLTHSQGLLDTTYDAAGYSFSLGGKARRWSMGVSGSFLQEGAIEGRDDTGAKSGDFRAADAFLGVSLARRTRDGLAIGGTVKGIQQRIAGESATGVAVDLGLTTGALWRGLTLGLAVKNLGPAMTFINERTPLPTEGSVGLGYQMGSLLFVADATHQAVEGDTRLGGGVEFMPVDILSLRLGYQSSLRASAALGGGAPSQLSRLAGLAAGLGLNLGRYQIDYALLSHAALEQTHRVSLSAAF